MADIEEIKEGKILNYVDSEGVPFTSYQIAEQIQKLTENQVSEYDIARLFRIVLINGERDFEDLLSDDRNFLTEKNLNIFYQELGNSLNAVSNLENELYAYASLYDKTITGLLNPPATKRADNGVRLLNFNLGIDRLIEDVKRLNNLTNKETIYLLKLSLKEHTLEEYQSFIEPKELSETLERLKELYEGNEEIRNEVERYIEEAEFKGPQLKFQSEEGRQLTIPQVVEQIRELFSKNESIRDIDIYFVLKLLVDIYKVKKEKFDALTKGPQDGTFSAEELIELRKLGEFDTLNEKDKQFLIKNNLVEIYNQFQKEVSLRDSGFLKEIENYTSLLMDSLIKESVIVGQARTLGPNGADRRSLIVKDFKDPEQLFETIKKTYDVNDYFISNLLYRSLGDPLPDTEEEFLKESFRTIGEITKEKGLYTFLRELQTRYNDANDGNEFKEKMKKFLTELDERLREERNLPKQF